MHIQLSDYFQQTLPKHELIDYRITPLLAKVRRHHINSIHQLEGQLNETKSETSKVALNSEKQKFIFSGREAKEQLRSGESGEKTFAISQGRFYSTIQSKPKRQSKTMNVVRKNLVERVIIQNPEAKVKKHLIDSIDFKELQRAMYQKSEKLSVFQNFCQKLKVRGPTMSHKRSLSKNHRTVRLRDSELVQCEEEDFDIGYKAEENSFRITQKKRFWRGATDSRKRGLVDHNCLKVKGFRSTII